MTLVICGLLQVSTLLSGSEADSGSAKASTTGPAANRALAEEFIKWFELQYVNGMQKVGGGDTDVTDLIKEEGIEKTVERYAALRRVALDFAMNWPRNRAIPDADLNRIAQRQYEHVVSDARRSKKWLSYDNAKLKEGVIQSYKEAAVYWIPFYQKLLDAPTTSSAPADIEARVRQAVSRQEYRKMIDGISAANRTFYKGMKHGSSWYKPWSPWVRSSLDDACRMDIALCEATVKQIYRE